MKTIKYLTIVAVLWILTACSGQCPVKAEGEINRILELQRQAWNQGDLNGFMQPYWNSDSLVYIGSKGIKRGWNTLLKSYDSSYGKTEMGELDFSNIAVQKIAKNTMFVVGEWQLKRTQEPSVSGYFSLIWQYIDGNWVIISDHSS